MLNALPRTTEPDPIHDIMNNALKEWVENESKQTVKDDDIIRIYQNEEIYDGEGTSTLPYYYLEWEPEVNFETWYLHMIDTANQHGYTVYSDVDQQFYFPNGTSIPPNAYRHLRAMAGLQQNRIDEGYDTVLKIMQEEADNPPDPTQISEHLFNAHSRVVLITAILQHCLDKYGIKAIMKIEKGKEFKIICPWHDDTQFIIDFNINYLFSLKVRFSYFLNFQLFDPVTSKRINNINLKRKLYQLGMDFSFIMRWSDDKDFYLVKSEKYQKTIETLRKEQPNILDSLDEELDQTRVANTVTELHTKLTQHMDNFVKNVYGYGSLYNFIDASFHKTHPLYLYLWSSIYKVPELGSILQLTRFAGHPKLPEMIAQQLKRVQEVDKIPNSHISEVDRKILMKYAEKYLSKDEKSLYKKLNYLRGCIHKHKFLNK